jgi:hypothetical protein
MILIFADENGLALSVENAASAPSTAAKPDFEGHSWQQTVFAKRTAVIFNRCRPSAAVAT